MKDNRNQLPSQYEKSKGFTLIELLIVIAIVGILAAVGYPSYTEYVKKSRRADGHLALLNSVQSMERCKTTQFTYATCTLPGSLANSPEGHYSIAIGAGITASSFTIQATAQASQATDTGCVTLTINELGVRAPAQCW